MVDFLVIGNGSVAGLRYMFELFKTNKVRYGYSIQSGYILFEVSDIYEFYGTICKEEEGSRFIAVSGVRWFTNMRNTQPPMLELIKTYIDGEYKKFDNYDAIYVCRTCDIPKDYYGVMGVPVTFLDKWNSEQFELIGCLYSDMCYVEGDHKFSRILIKRK